MTTEMTMSNRESNLPEKMQQLPAFAPPVDIYENKDELVIMADLPGVTSEDLKVNIENDQLNIEARRSDLGPGEQPFEYRRSFTVPGGIDAEGIVAHLQGGVLKVVLPKPASMKPRQIEVKAS